MGKERVPDTESGMLLTQDSNNLTGIALPTVAYFVGDFYFISLSTNADRMKQIAFIIHGKIKKRQEVIRQIESTFQGNYKLSFLISEYAGHAVELAYKAAGEGFEYIISLGGDGSLNEVVNGFMQAKARNKEVIAKLGTLPFGTGNDFIKTSKSPSSIEGIKKLIDENVFKEIDLGLVQFQNKTGVTSSRYFINITDIGLGGVVVQKIENYTKVLPPGLAYFVLTVKTLLLYRNQPIKAIAEGFTFEGKVKNFVIANGKYFGSGLGIAPDAEIDSGRFEMVIIGEASLFDFLRLSSTLKKCKRVDHPHVMYRAGKEITIHSTLTPQPIDLDGEFVGYTPMNVKIQPKAITFLC